MSSSHLTALPNGYRLQEYELQSVLGQGTFGITYKAFDTQSKRFVAIKEYFPREFSARDKGSTVLASGSRSDVESFDWGLTRFVDEAKTLARFDHPNLIAVRRFFQSNGTAYLVMDYCDGEPLDVMLEQEVKLDEARIKKFLMPLLDGLELVHATDVIHRDIKPGNIFIKSDGTPVLLDFGAARQDLSSHSRSVTSLATPGYAAVEQYATRGRLGPWTDIYGLGATLYRCVTGVKPQGALDRQLEDELEPAAKLAKDHYSAAFLKAIDWSLAVRSEQRPQSIKQWREKLLASAPAQSMPVTGIAGTAAGPGIHTGMPAGVTATAPNKKPQKFLLFALAAIVSIFVLAKIFSHTGSDVIESEPISEIAAAEAPPDEAPVPELILPDAPVPAPEAAVPAGKQNVTDFMYGEALYTGQIVDGVPEGKGEIRWSNGLVDKGRFSAGQLNGKGTRTWPGGNKHVGNFLNGDCSGFGTTYYPQGSRFEAIWVDCGTGEGTYYDKNGEAFPRTCRDGNCSFKSVEAAAPVPAPAPAPAAPSVQNVTNMAYRGGTYSGAVIDGVPNGRGEYRYGNGTLDKGEFVQGNLHGKGSRVWSNGVKHVGQFSNDVCYGDGVQYYSDNSKFDAKWTDCKNGEGIYTFADGTVGRSKLTDGKWFNY